MGLGCSKDKCQKCLDLTEDELIKLLDIFKRHFLPEFEDVVKKAIQQELQALSKGRPIEAILEQLLKEALKDR